MSHNKRNISHYKKYTLKVILPKEYKKYTLKVILPKEYKKLNNKEISLTKISGIAQYHEIRLNNNQKIFICVSEFQMLEYLNQELCITHIRRYTLYILWF